MGLGNSANRTFLSVSDGKIVQRCTEHTPGAIARVKKDNTTVYELRFGYIEGLLTSISTKETEWNGAKIKSWILGIHDNGQDYQLEVKFDSSYATSMFKAFGNPAIDFTQPIKFGPYMKVVNDKKKTSIYISQNGENIEWYYTKENPNGMPEMKQVIVKGQPVWDNFDQMQFIEQMVETKVKPQLKAVTPAYQTPEYAAPADIGAAFEDDDLPFA